MLVKMGSICHLANIKSCFTHTFMSLLLINIVGFRIFIQLYIYCLYKGEDIIGCNTCI